MPTVWDSYDGTAVAVVARTLHAQTSRIDVLSNDRHDYVGALRVVGLRAVHSFRDKHAGRKAEEEARYVYASFWRAARRCKQKRQVHAKRLKSEPVIPATTLRCEVDRHYEARDALRVLESRLPPQEWDTLIRVAEGGAAAVARDQGIELSTFCKRIGVLRAKARALLLWRRRRAT